MRRRTTGDKSGLEGEIVFIIWQGVFLRGPEEYLVGGLGLYEDVVRSSLSTRFCRRLVALAASVAGFGEPRSRCPGEESGKHQRPSGM